MLKGRNKSWALNKPSKCYKHSDSLTFILLIVKKSIKHDWLVRIHKSIFNGNRIT